MSGLIMVFFVTLGLAAMGAGPSAQAAYPSKAIQFVVPYAPGGATDVISRIMAKYLSAEFKVPVNVVNKDGGNQIPAVTFVLGAPPDGHILLSDGMGSSSMHALVKDLPYTMEERTFGPMWAQAPLAFVVNADSSWNSLKEIADAAKKDPGSFTYGRLGGTSAVDFATAQFLEAAGIDMSRARHVSFTGAGPAMIAVAGGHVMFAAGGVGTVFPLLSSGKIKVLAVTGSKRVASLSRVPSATEAGFPSVDLIPWYGTSGPKALPKEILDVIDGVTKKIVENPAYVKEMEAVGHQPVYMAPDDARKYVLKEAEGLKAFSAKLQRVGK